MEELKVKWLAEEELSFRGWDFSHLDNRWSQGDIPWSYREIVLEHLKTTDELLDMGTGGGEFLLSLGHPYEKTSVTEAWEVNIELCKEILSPLGVKVYEVEDDSSLPIADDSFDIVLNRHEAYDLSEVSRVLRAGGLFITQQVAEKDCESLAKRIDDNYKSMYEGFNLSNEIKSFDEHGFEILYSEEAFPQLKFFDVGAIVYFMKIIQWTFPNFSVENNLTELEELQRQIEHDGEIVTEQHRFIIVAKNVK